jgi:hypothetical protein
VNEYREELISPDGRVVTSTSPVETNNLLYGGGYRRAADVEGEPGKPEPAKADAPKADVAPKSPFASGGPVAP